MVFLINRVQVLVIFVKFIALNFLLVSMKLSKIVHQLLLIKQFKSKMRMRTFTKTCLGYTICLFICLFVLPWALKKWHRIVKVQTCAKIMHFVRKVTESQIATDLIRVYYWNVILFKYYAKRDKHYRYINVSRPLNLNIYFCNSATV